MPMIIVPVADLERGREAVARAREEALRTGAEIVIVGATTVSGDLVANVEALRDLIEKLEKELLNDGVQCRTIWRVGESLARAALDAASELDADLIVTNLRRRTPVGKAVLGSYEQTILLNAECPVLALPADPW